MKKSFVLVVFLMFLGTINTTFAQKDYQTKPKYVFLFIGDGMGLAHISLTQAYLSAIDGKIGFKQLTMTEFPVVGFATTFAQTRLITCSAAAGTALSTGTKTSPGTIAMNFNHTDTLYSIANWFKNEGFKVGLISSVFVNDATPSVFYAHATKRTNLYEIAKQFITSRIDLIGGGKFANEDDNGQNTNIYELLPKSGYKVVNNKKDFEKLTNKDSKVCMYSPDCLKDASMPFVLDQTKQTIKLSDFTQKAIDVLYNPKGFFIMVEGGKIDWAAHNNDASSIIAEVIDFDNAINVALNFYKQHPNETLIIVTADHETGGLTLGYRKTEYESDIKILQGQKGSIGAYEDTIQTFINKNGIDNFTYLQMLQISSYFFNFDTISLSFDEKNELKNSYLNFIEKSKKKDIKETKYSSNPLSKKWLEIRNHKAGIDFTSGSHTASPVPVFAIGAGSLAFMGYYDNTDIPRKISQLVGLKSAKFKTW